MLTKIQNYEIENINNSLWNMQVVLKQDATYIWDNICFQNGIYLAVFGKWHFVITSVEKTIWENHAN